MKPHQAPRGRVEIKTAPRGLVLAQPHNVQRVRDTLDKLKPLKFVKFESVRKGVKRTYPMFFPGMTTARYVQLYVSYTESLHASLVRLAHACPNYEDPAPMLDPREPEVLHETIDEGLTT